MSFVEVHFDGDFAYNHQVSLRNLSRTLTCLQSAIDRAHLDNAHGRVWKHARMSFKDYKVTDFLVQPPEEGGYILKFLSTSEKNAKEIIQRITAALLPAYEKAMDEGEIEINKYKNKVVERKAQLSQGNPTVKSYESIIQQPDSKMVRQYGDRAIVKEVDKMLVPVRTNNSENNIIELTFNAEITTKFTFDKTNSQRFHSIVSQKDLGIPVIYRANIKSLDNDVLRGRMYNLDSRKDAYIHFHNIEDLLKLHPFLARKEEVRFIGSPIIEYGTFDPDAGDIYFLDLYS
ncbi:hypothetical protein [Leptolyngbya sp. ST-U4]|uniref:hypothetical protein n=1 Tax=Leptolyngbya sp. ST-U4 TaxID=2933912 RepID=UPI003298ABA4